MEFTIDQALQKAIEAHKAGQVQEADRLYTAILKAQPKHPDANHNLGVLAVSVGKAQEALPFLKTALEANPSIAQFWFSYIDALIKLDNFVEAKALLAKAKSKGAKGEAFDLLTKRLSIINKTADSDEIGTSAETKKTNVLDMLKLDQALNLAKKKTKLGLFSEARSIYKDIHTKFPDNYRANAGLKSLIDEEFINLTHVQDPAPDQLQLLTALFEKGEFAKALKQAEVLVAKFPSSAVLFNIKGALLKASGQSIAAIEAYKRALSINPDFAEASNKMGNAFLEQGKLDEAIKAYKRALEINPNYAEAHYNMSIALRDQGKLSDALLGYNKAIALKPDYAVAYYNKANILRDKRYLQEALAAYNGAINANPNYAEAFNNKGNILKDLGKLEEAIDAYNSALAIQPGNAVLFSNKGSALQDQGNLEEAVEAYRKAININPDYAEAHRYLGFALLNSGKIRAGLHENEWRFKTVKGRETQRYFLQPSWDGKTSLINKRVLVWCEQGIGDTITWSSCLPFVSSEAGHCILECQEKLIPLLSRSFPDIEIRPEDRSRDNSRDDFDFHIPIGSLYYHFFSRLIENIIPVAHLVADPDRILYWRERLKALGNGPYVGISWKSSDMSPKRLPNYAKIPDWSPILTLSDVTLVNLQYTDFSDDLNTMQNDFGVTVHNFNDLDHLNDLDNVAALCAALDVVVATKSAVPLISASVGTLTKLANWRQSPWNNFLLNPVGPLVDIFERDTKEPWINVFNIIADDIKNMTSTCKGD